MCSFRVVNDDDVSNRSIFCKDLLLSFFNESNLKPGKIIFYRYILPNMMLTFVVGGALLNDYCWDN